MTNSKTDSVPSLIRGLKVLELLTESKRGLSISDLSRRLVIPKSSVHLLVTTLERQGYLQRNGRTGHFRLGLKLVSLSRLALDGLNLRDEARPLLESLMKKTGLTVHLGVLERNEAVIVEKIEAPGLTQVATWVGRRMDVNCTGIGKALIANLPPPEFDAQIKPSRLARHNYKTIVSLNKLRRELSLIRAQGYAFDDEEDEIGLRCIGAAVFDSQRAVVAAISVAGTSAQIPLERVPSLASLVKKTASGISSRL